MMMTNLFSIFDPSMSLLSYSWLSVFLFIFLLPMLYPVSGGSSFLFLSFVNEIKKEINHTIKTPFKGVYIFFSSVMLMIFLYNFLAMFPFIFSVTSHLLSTLPLSYSFWLGIIIFSWFSSIKHFMSHLIPVGTPVLLISFMVLVEILSNLIRPLALTFRLTANMMAGHLLMSLIGSALINLSFLLMLSGGVVQSLLVIMELGVSFIQSYVFCTLLILYLSESGG